MNAKHLSSTLLVALACSAAPAAWAAGAPDCGPNPNPGQTVLPVFNPAVGAYCVSSFGSSNSFFVAGANGSAPYPSTYDQSADLFSGDDAVNLQFKVGGVRSGGSGWLAPSLDAGTLAPGGYATQSAWTVLNPVAYTAPNVTDSTRSTIRLALPTGNLQVTINTTISAAGEVKQIYSIVNNTTSDLTDLTFADYFNFHPNGSFAANTLLGTTRFDNNSIVTRGDENDASSFISHGSMRLIDGSTGETLTPTAYSVGCADFSGLAPECSGTTATLLDVENGAYNSFTGPTSQGDHAGALAYNLGTLAAGQTAQIGLVKTVAVSPIPEPSQAMLLLAGLTLFGGRRLALRTARWRRRA